MSRAAHDSCPECGAQPANCGTRFDQFLALEFSDPAYGSVHHLTVPAYMLQHPSQLSVAGWQAMRKVLHDFLERGVCPDEVRQRNRATRESDKRGESLKHGPRLHLPEAFSWRVTILDLPDAPAADYRAGIERWARQVLQDSALLAAANESSTTDSTHRGTLS